MFLRVFAVFFVLMFAFSGQCQTFENDYANAKNKRFAGQYKQADSLFKIVLKKYKKKLPEEICYHYGVVLYSLGDKAQAVSFLKKYNNFQKNNLQYRDSANYYLNKIAPYKTHIDTNHRVLLRVDTCKLCHGQGHAIQKCSKCSGTGKVLCYNCQGRGVVGSSKDLGLEQFNKCHVCKGAGSLECQHCHGGKVVDEKCLKCNGSGKVFIYK